MFKELVIIGGGPAGNAAALAAADAGASSVVLIERDAMGGTCTNRGCVPTKFLLSRSGALPSGDPSSPAPAEWQRLIGHKTALVKGLSRTIEERCVRLGVAILRGSARFVGPNELLVSGPGGEAARVEGRNFISATGSEPAQLPGAPADGECIITSTEALDLKRLPASLAVIGSGAVGPVGGPGRGRQGRGRTRPPRPPGESGPLERGHATFLPDTDASREGR